MDMAQDHFTLKLDLISSLKSSLYISHIVCAMRAVCRSAVYSAPNVQHCSRESIKIRIEHEL